MAELISADELRVWFPVRPGILEALSGTRRYVKAVDGVSLKIEEGETLCLVGESGSGKTTLGRTLVGLVKPTAGTVTFEDVDVHRLSGEALKAFRRRAQMIFQDPYEALEPRMTIRQILEEPLIIHGLGGPYERMSRIVKVLDEVGLGRELLPRYPHELSGGQRQRVAIARALVLDPKFIVADEPVSMLDGSIRSDILNLLIDLKRRKGLTYLYITHDLGQARYMGDKIAVMYAGRIVEYGPADAVLERPVHPYTKTLMSHVPILEPSQRRWRLEVGGEPPNLINPPLGCTFHPRCPFAIVRCVGLRPELEPVGQEHLAACHVFKREDS
jgi:peptide/nickel transport system ATP-binding protein